MSFDCDEIQTSAGNGGGKYASICQRILAKSGKCFGKQLERAAGASQPAPKALAPFKVLGGVAGAPVPERGAQARAQWPKGQGPGLGARVRVRGPMARARGPGAAKGLGARGPPGAPGASDRGIKD